MFGETWTHTPWRETKIALTAVFEKECVVFLVADYPDTFSDIESHVFGILHAGQADRVIAVPSDLYFDAERTTLSYVAKLITGSSGSSVELSGDVTDVMPVVEPEFDDEICTIRTGMEKAGALPNWIMCQTRASRSYRKRATEAELRLGERDYVKSSAAFEKAAQDVVGTYELLVHKDEPCGWLGKDLPLVAWRESAYLSPSCRGWANAMGYMTNRLCVVVEDLLLAENPSIALARWKSAENYLRSSQSTKRGDAKPVPTTGSLSRERSASDYDRPSSRSPVCLASTNSVTLSGHLVSKVKFFDAPNTNGRAEFDIVVSDRWGNGEHVVPCRTFGKMETGLLESANPGDFVALHGDIRSFAGSIFVLARLITAVVPRELLPKRERGTDSAGH